MLSRSFAKAATRFLTRRIPISRFCSNSRLRRTSDHPLIPLGTRGKIRGTDYEVIGFERRTIHVDGAAYSWHEYVLFNPFKGFRYLTRIRWSLERLQHAEGAAGRGFILKPSQGEVSGRDL